MISILLSLMMIHLGGTFAQGSLQFRMGFDENTGIMSTLEEISQNHYPVSNHFNRPERIAGVNDKALRLDGFSTWVSLYPFQLSGINSQLTVEAWYATEAFNFEKSSVISQQSADKGFSLSITRFGNVVLEFFADNNYYQLITNQTISTYTWNHLVALIDLPEQNCRIYVNGQLWASLETGNHNSIQLAQSQAMFVGRNTNFQTVGGFPVSCLNGALDELSLYKSILTEEQITTRYQQFQHLTPDLQIDPAVRHADDKLRPSYHAMPNTGWTNESYGLLHYQDSYHMFFQKNPNAPQLFFMHWGHLSSKDLVSWKEEKIALSPSPGFDNFGVWSGSSILKDESPMLIFTGVDGVKAGIGSASACNDSLTCWQKNPDNPLIPAPPSGYAHRDFRDPYVWKSDSIYYMVIGSGLQQNGGGILFTYRSVDLQHWENISPLYQSDEVSQSGEFWEMPVFCPIDDTNYLLAVTPIPTSSKRAETIYWVGNWQDEKFTPYLQQPKKLELIQENLLSPAFGRDEQNRLSYLAIIPEDRNAADQVAAGWRHIFSLPRVVRLLADHVTLGQIPHPNLCRLRKDTLTIASRTITAGQTGNLDELHGNQLELQLNILASEKSKFEIQVFKNEASTVYTSVVLDLNHHKVALDRRKSTIYDAGKDYRDATYIFDHNDTINVRMFLDHSVLEVFIDHIVVFSTRVYPPENCTMGDVIVHNGEVVFVNGFIWQMKSFIEPMDSLVCEVQHLPDSLRTPPQGGLGNKEQHSSRMLIYPNPSSGHFQIDLNSSQPDKLKVINLLGKSIFETEVSQKDTSMRIDIQHFRSGVYLVQTFKNGITVASHKILLQSQ